jgi:hypothetical protein
MAPSSASTPATPKSCRAVHELPNETMRGGKTAAADLAVTQPLIQLRRVFTPAASPHATLCSIRLELPSLLRVQNSTPEAIRRALLMMVRFLSVPTDVKYVPYQTTSELRIGNKLGLSCQGHRQDMQSRVSPTSPTASRRRYTRRRQAHHHGSLNRAIGAAVKTL